jgi:protein involved in ribonucleotide reduction
MEIDAHRDIMRVSAKACAIQGAIGSGGCNHGLIFGKARPTLSGVAASPIITPA